MNVSSNPPVNPLSSKADDFKRIRGIGPAIESRLHQAGILTYSQFASKTPEEIAAILTGLTGLSIERIVKQDWIGQAHAMASEEYIEAAAVEATSENHQHYATYTLELLLDGENSVRRSRIVYVQRQDEKVWAGWDPERLIDYIMTSAQFQISDRVEAPVLTEIPEKELKSASRASSEASPITGKARLSEMMVFTTEDERAQSSLPYGQAFQALMDIDLSDLKTERKSPLTYQAVLSAHTIGGGPRFPVGESRGTIQPAESEVQIAIQCKPIPKGLYRLETALVISPPLEPMSSIDYKSHMEGNLLQIY